MGHASHVSHGSHGSHANHANHTSYGDPDNITYTNTGTPKVLTWSNWGTIADDEYISQSVNKIKELRDKIQYLKDNHGGGTWNGGIENGTINLSSVPDTEFDGVGEDYVEDVHYDNLKDSLDTMRTALGLSTTGLPAINDGAIIDNEHFANLKAQIDSLAAADITAQYSNHNNHENHQDHASHGSYYN